MEDFVRRTEEFNSMLNSLCSRVFKVIDTNPSISQETSLTVLCAVKQELFENFENYEKVHGEFSSYLNAMRTEQSNAELETLTLNDNKFRDQVLGFLQRVEEFYTVKLQSSLHKSVSSKSEISDKQSSVSKPSVVAIKQAKAEAARIKVSFAEQEATLKLQKSQIVEEERKAAAHADRQKTDLEIKLQLLRDQKDAAAAEAEAEALSGSRGGSLKMFSIPEMNPAQKTAEYIVNHTPSQHLLSPSAPVFQPGAAHLQTTNCGPQHSTPMPQNVNIERQNQEYSKMETPRPQDFLSVQQPPKTETLPHAPPMPQQPPKTETLPHAPPMPQQPPKTETLQPLTPPKPQEPQITDFTNFLLKKELLLSRLTKFTDKPENYRVWKVSFKNIVTELKVTAFEELDLLAKWLGTESARQAINIRAANMNNPELGRIRVWERLEEKYGAAEMVEDSLKKKLREFPALSPRDNKKLFDLCDIVSEIEAIKEDPQYSALLGYYDSSSGVNPIVCKLPHGIREKWITQASKYKQTHNVPFPPFSFFARFLRDISKVRNDPSLTYDTPGPPRDFAKKVESKQGPHVITRKTEVEQLCPIHKTAHSLNQCRAFKLKPLEERKKWLRENNYCYRCCESSDHKSKECRAKIQCTTCNTINKHPSAMHRDAPDKSLPPPASLLHGNVSEPKSYSSRPIHGEEPDSGSHPARALQGGERQKSSAEVASKCTQVCGGSTDNFQGKSCAKYVLVNVYAKGERENAVKMYAILDDQSNRTLAKTEFFDLLNATSNEVEYTLTSCAGTFVTSGKTAKDFMVESADGSFQLELPSILECNEIPNVRHEIPTPDVTRHHSHLNDLSPFIPSLDTEASILLLIGRDLPEAHHVLDQRVGPIGSPYAQKLPLGWVVIGETCLGGIHKTDFVNTNKTFLLSNGRSSCFKPCSDQYRVTEKGPPCLLPDSDMIDPVFQRKPDDDKPSLSIEDKQFIQQMDKGFRKDGQNRWSAPLPFRPDRPTLPNNREQAVKRANALHSSLRKNPVKCQQFVEFMGTMFDRGHAEVAPPLRSNEECWFLPVFGVYHPQKPNQIRCVFDSSAKHDGISLNSVLLQGPDLTNSLLGILLRLRKEPVAISGDIQQMFYSFRVHEEDRNFLRFLWYEDNNPEKHMIEYRMCVHVFGNSPSPAIATYGLRKSVEGSDEMVKSFVNDDFYVDDALTSVPTATEAVNLMKKTQQDLTEHGIVLHKVVSNKEEVIQEFPTEQLAKTLENIEIGHKLPVHRSLGLRWDLSRDTFFFDAPMDEKPYTRRGVLSVINSLFDPIGFMAPVTIQGKLILRDLMKGNVDWDDPLPPDKLSQWSTWKSSLPCLNQIHVARGYSERSLSEASSLELLVFCDASELAISAVAYLLTNFLDGRSEIGFVMGKTKVAPSSGHTIPRLELCAAVLGVEISVIAQENLGVQLSSVKFFSDSKVVLGYIGNQTRRFFTYVANRVEKIRSVSSPQQWNFVPTHLNPADDGTRGLPVENMKDSKWLNGPQFLLKEGCQSECPEVFPLISPEEDCEVRKEVQVLKTDVSSESLGTKRFEKFSSWKRLVKAITKLRHIVQTFHKGTNCSGWHNCRESDSVESYEEASNFILREVQHEVYDKEISLLKENKPVPKNSAIYSLNPYVGPNGLLRVGGRLSRAPCLTPKEKHPVIVPNTHVAKLLVTHFHESVKHQGRLFTEGAVRTGGFWIVGGKRLVSSVIHRCVQCKKLRGHFESQKMSELPSDRLEKAPPFTYVGLDTFGPWSVTTRKTRGGAANSKRWAILFTCLCVRAIHIEVVEDMSSSAFINALRRFIAVRGKVKQFRSDRGTNFVGATDDLKINAINVEDETVKQFFLDTGSTWLFNTPHSSHMGGVWERMIGTVRRILESMLVEVKNLTHEVLVTLMAEISAIVNSRPLVPVSYDSEAPEVLTPTMLLTQKTDADVQSLTQLDVKDLYRSQWKRVQHLADIFWTRWQREYLHTLQSRRKWANEHKSLQVGDIVLMKDHVMGRLYWPIGRVEKVFPSEDGRIRKIEVRTVRDGKVVNYVRPVVEVIFLVNSTNGVE